MMGLVLANIQKTTQQKIASPEKLISIWKSFLRRLDSILYTFDNEFWYDWTISAYFLMASPFDYTTLIIRVENTIISSLLVPVNLCQKPLLFAQHGENTLCTNIVLNVRNNFCAQHVLPRLEVGIIEQVIQWTICCHIVGYLMQKMFWAKV